MERVVFLSSATDRRSAWPVVDINLPPAPHLVSSFSPGPNSARDNHLQGDDCGADLVFSCFLHPDTLCFSFTILTCGLLARTKTDKEEKLMPGPPNKRWCFTTEQDLSTVMYLLNGKPDKPTINVTIAQSFGLPGLPQISMALPTFLVFSCGFLPQKTGH